MIKKNTIRCFSNNNERSNESQTGYRSRPAKKKKNLSFFAPLKLKRVNGKLISQVNNTNKDVNNLNITEASLKHILPRKKGYSINRPDYRNTRKSVRLHKLLYDFKTLKAATHSKGLTKKSKQPILYQPTTSNASLVRSKLPTNPSSFKVKRQKIRNSFPSKTTLEIRKQRLSGVHNKGTRLRRLFRLFKALKNNPTVYFKHTVPIKALTSSKLNLNTLIHDPATKDPRARFRHHNNPRIKITWNKNFLSERRSVRQALKNLEPKVVPKLAMSKEASAVMVNLPRNYTTQKLNKQKEPVIIPGRDLLRKIKGFIYKKKKKIKWPKGSGKFNRIRSARQRYGSNSGVRFRLRSGVFMRGKLTARRRLKTTQRTIKTLRKQTNPSNDTQSSAVYKHNVIMPYVKNKLYGLLTSNALFSNEALDRYRVGYTRRFNVFTKLNNIRRLRLHMFNKKFYTKGFESRRNERIRRFIESSFKEWTNYKNYNNPYRRLIHKYNSKRHLQTQKGQKRVVYSTQKSTSGLKGVVERITVMLRKSNIITSSFGKTKRRSVLKRIRTYSQGRKYKRISWGFPRASNEYARNVIKSSSYRRQTSLPQKTSLHRPIKRTSFYKLRDVYSNKVIHGLYFKKNNLSIGNHQNLLQGMWSSIVSVVGVFGTANNLKLPQVHLPQPQASVHYNPAYYFYMSLTLPRSYHLTNQESFKSKVTSSQNAITTYSSFVTTHLNSTLSGRFYYDNKLDSASRDGTFGTNKLSIVSDITDKPKNKLQPLRIQEAFFSIEFSTSRRLAATPSALISVNRLSNTNRDFYTNVFTDGNHANSYKVLGSATSKPSQNDGIFASGYGQTALKLKSVLHTKDPRLESRFFSRSFFNKTFSNTKQSGDFTKLLSLIKPYSPYTPVTEMVSLAPTLFIWRLRRRVRWLRRRLILAFLRRTHYFQLRRKSFQYRRARTKRYKLARRIQRQLLTTKKVGISTRLLIPIRVTNNKALNEFFNINKKSKVRLTDQTVNFFDKKIHRQFRRRVRRRIKRSIRRLYIILRAARRRLWKRTTNLRYRTSGDLYKPRVYGMHLDTLIDPNRAIGRLVTNPLNYVHGFRNTQTTPALKSTILKGSLLNVNPLKYMNLHILSSFITNPFLLKSLFWNLVTDNKGLGSKNLLSVVRRVMQLSNTSGISQEHLTTTNLWPHKSFNFVVKKKLMNFFANQSMRLNLIPWYYNTLIRFIEHTTGHKALVQFYPFIHQSLTKDAFIRYRRWLPRMGFYERKLGHRFFLEEALHIMHLSFTLRDALLFGSWLKAIILRISFWKTRSIFRFLKYLMNNYYRHVFADVGIKGLKIKLKGKISAAGNSRKRTILYRVGLTSHSTVDLKISYQSFLINTFTGVMGFQIWLFY